MTSRKIDEIFFVLQSALDSADRAVSDGEKITFVSMLFPEISPKNVHNALTNGNTS